MQQNVLKGSGGTVGKGWPGTGADGDEVSGGGVWIERAVQHVEWQVGVPSGEINIEKLTSPLLVLKQPLVEYEPKTVKC